MRLLFFVFLSLMLFAQCEKPRQLTLYSGQSSISIDLEIGGRVSSLMFGDIEILQTTRDSNQVQWGSTVWPSPQKDWAWPPPSWIDTEPYSLIESSDRYIVMLSPISPETQLQCRKTILVLGVDSFLLQYTFINHGSDSLRVGIWENTRIPYGGKVDWEEERLLWELGPDDQAAPSFNTLNLTRHKKSRKIFSKSEGGYLRYENNGVLFKKTFEAIDPELIANKQTAIEIYYDPKSGFAELELHGKYEYIDPGEEVDFEVVWALSAVE